MKRLACSDAGYPDCQHVMEAENEDEVMRQAREHGKNVHGMKELGPDMEQKLRTRIKNV